MNMTFTFAPEYAWQLWLAALLVVAAGATLAAAWWPLRRRHLGAARTTRIVVTSGTAIAAVFLAIGLAAPALQRRGDRASFHVVVLLDVSDNISPGILWPPRQTTICPLGPSAVSPIMSVIPRFRHEFDHYIQHGRPIDGVERHRHREPIHV